MRSVTARVALALAVVAAAAGARADQLRGISGPSTLEGRFLLGVAGDKARITKDGGGRVDWVIKRTKDGTLIREEDGGYLSYDVTGKRKEVFLTKEAGQGSYWDVQLSRVKGVRPYDTVIRARNGKLRGAYLGAGDEAEAHRDRDGKRYRARQAVLVEKPKVVPRYYLFPIAP
jgi:hypothetical protein